MPLELFAAISRLTPPQAGLCTTDPQVVTRRPATGRTLTCNNPHSRHTDTSSSTMCMGIPRKPAVWHLPSGHVTLRAGGASLVGGVEMVTALGEWAGGVWGLLGAVEPVLGAFLAPASAQACIVNPLMRSMCNSNVRIQAFFRMRKNGNERLACLSCSTRSTLCRRLHLPRRFGIPWWCSRRRCCCSCCGRFRFLYRRNSSLVDLVAHQNSMLRVAETLEFGTDAAQHSAAHLKNFCGSVLAVCGGRDDLSDVLVHLTRSDPPPQRADLY